MLQISYYQHLTGHWAGSDNSAVLQVSTTSGTTDKCYKCQTNQKCYKCQTSAQCYKCQTTQICYRCQTAKHCYKCQTSLQCYTYTGELNVTDILVLIRCLHKNAFTKLPLHSFGQSDCFSTLFLIQVSFIQATAFLFPVTFITTYAIAVSSGHADSFWPYISDTGKILMISQLYNLVDLTIVRSHLSDNAKILFLWYW